MLARTLAVGLLAGVLAGALVSAAQMVRIVPLILQAEVFEIADHSEHIADKTTWSPEDGFERTTYTLITNLLVGAGFGLLLVGAFVLAQMAGRSIDAFRGLLWGVAGFLVFPLMPSIGLPPELPDTAAAELSERQPSYSAGRFGSKRWPCRSLRYLISSARRSRPSTAERPRLSSRRSS